MGCFFKVVTEVAPCRSDREIRFPLGKHGAFAFKYYRDTFAQNKPWGNTLWFQLAVPLGALAENNSR